MKNDKINPKIPLKNDKNDVIYLDLRATVAVHKGFRSPYVRGVPVGYEEQAAMYPLSFGKFLLNAGLDEKVFEYVQSVFYRHRTFAFAAWRRTSGENS